MSERVNVPDGPPAFSYPARMRFSDTDAMGHVNNARFLSYLEDARIELFRWLVARGAGIAESGVIVARIEIDYVRPLRLRAEPVLVSIWVTHVGRSSFTLSYTLEQEGEVAARARSVMVAYDYAADAPRPIDDPHREVLRDLMTQNSSSIEAARR